MITSTENKQIKQIVQLNTKAKARKKTGLFAVEGVKMFLEAPLNRIEKVYVSESFYQEEEKKELLLNRNVSYEVVEDKIFNTICDTLTPQGILTLVKQKSYTLKDLLPKGERTPLILILESLQDPGNLGTMIRTGEGAGISGVLMNKTTVDVTNPKTLRATMGSVYRIPLVISDDLKEDIARLKDMGVHVFAAHLKGEKDFFMEDYKKSCAFLVGNEGNGLSDDIAETADTYVKIPMDGEVESLNAAIAASVMMYECKRQRMTN
ncbi:MAG: RNA methyltransferase [Lachnospiraceae bacterium]|nr:RNA methyltransferase [Lachnospiraceae bacterium]